MSKLNDLSDLPFDDDHPERFPTYEVATRIRLTAAGETAVVGLKNSALAAHFADGQVLHFDLEGRLTRVAQPPLQWRRGLSGRTIQLRKRTGEEGGGFERRLLSDAETDQLINRTNSRMVRLWEAFERDRGDVVVTETDRSLLEVSLHDVVRSAANFDVQAARRDVDEFRAIYHDVPILPPDQYSSLVLAATEGCRYNHCTFCGFYRGLRYRAKTSEEFQRHLEQAVRYHGRGLAQRRAIFLGQANAMMGSRQWREEILHTVNQALELPSPGVESVSPSWWQGSPRRFTGITSFLDAFVGVRITAEEFRAMRELNLRQIFIGMETGDAQLLEWLKKPATPAQMLDTVKAAKAGGLRVGVILLIGAGGERFFESHICETVKLIRAMGLERGDFVYLSPLLSAGGTEYAALAAAEKIEALGPARMAEQEQRIRDGIGSSPSRAGPYVARYEVEHFVY